MSLVLTTDAPFRDELAERREAARRRLLDEELAIEARLEQRAADLEARSALLDERRDEQERADGQRRKLAQMLAHDIKNHLAVVKSNGAFVLEEGFGGANRATLEQAVAAADRALDLTAQFGTIERIEVLEPARIDVDLRDLFARVTDEMAPLARATGARLDRQAGGVHARLDARLVRRVLENLVDNAIRHGGARLVTLRAEESPGGGFCVSVEDDGVGLPAATRLALLSPSADGEAVLRKAQGLAFCRAAVVAHGGTLSIEDAAPQGTRVRLDFPG